MTLPNMNWNYPTTIWFGNGRIAELQQACDTLGISKPLFVTDSGLANMDFVQAVFKGLKSAVFYSDVQGNPTGQNVADGVAIYEQNNCDGVIAFGGGSGIDAAKAIALMAGQNLSVWDFEDVGDNWTRANANIIPKIIAVATTSGTGSEVGRASIITNTETEDKKIIFHPQMMPSLVIADPELTVGLPPHITAWTGMDALTHAVEAFCSPFYHPMASGIAIEAIRLVFENLPKAFADGTDLNARGHMQVAASMGATAFQKGLGSVHSLAHPLGAMYHAQHGLLNAILLPYALQQNRDATHDRMVFLCNALGIANAGTDGFINAVNDLRQTLQIPNTLADIDIDDKQADTVAEKAFLDPSTGGNAKPITADDLKTLFLSAVHGDMSRL